MQQHLSVFRTKKALGIRMIEKAQQVIKVAADIEQAARFVVKMQLSPGNDLDYFI